MRTRYLLVVLIVAGPVLPSPADETPRKEKIDQLIEQLGSSNFAEREKATKELEAIGPPALEALRKAAKSDDAEVRKRAETLLPKLEIQAQSIRILAPKRVHLVYKDMPLREAVADFQKKSGYTIRLHEPDDKLKERKITLDSGETSFWHAVALFCDKAELRELSMEDLFQAQQPPGGAGIAGGPRRVFIPGMHEQLLLKDGKIKKVPADDRRAVRIRALSKTDLFGKVPQGEILVPLEITPEPKLQIQNVQSIQIDKAVDDRDQDLAQVIPQVEGMAGIGGNLVVAPLGPGAGGNAQQIPLLVRQRIMGWGGLSQQIPLQLKKGAKEAKSLKEVKGSVTAQLLAEPRPVITADKLDQAAGKTFKCDEGGSIKIVGVASEEKETTIQLEFEPPPYDKVLPVQPAMMAGNGLRLGGARPGAAIQPMPVPVRIGRGGAAGGPPQLMESMNGLVIQDGKDHALPIDRSRCRVQMSVVQQGNGGPKQSVTYTLVCPHDKDKNKPAKVVYLGRKRVTVEIPFALKDVPLP
jgi:hypothetical protein